MDSEQTDDIDEIELERDFCIAMNMMLGETFDQAQQSAKQWMKEARE